MTSTTSDASHLETLLKSVVVPLEYSHYHRIVDADIISRLEKWKQKMDGCLSDLRDTVNRESPQFSARVQAQIISAATAFEVGAAWTTALTREASREILATFANPSTVLLEIILKDHVKPLFKFNPHPSLNISTGRILPENAGGPMASQDYYEGQVWKKHPGAPNLVSWCVRNTQIIAYESLWHLVIPPVMTMLDDYEASRKVQGIKIVSEMLGKVPKDLLRRTGVDGLIFTSLTISLTNLHNPLTPDIIRTAIPATLALIGLSTEVGSQARFDKLCALLGDGIIGNIWMYAYMDLDTMQATLDVLPSVLEMLGIGCARYLKGLIPQLTHPLLPKPIVSATQMQLASVQALTMIIQVCAPRMDKWRAAIVHPVAKCWVFIVDSGIDNEGTQKIKAALKDLCSQLAEVCPSVLQEDYPQLLTLGGDMFVDLVSHLKDR